MKAQSRSHGPLWFGEFEFELPKGVVYRKTGARVAFTIQEPGIYLLRVETSLVAARGASIEFRQRVLRGDKELVTALVLAAAIQDGRPARIPASLRRLLKAPA